MISISSKAIYGLAAMMELAAAPQNSPLQSKQIAEKQGIPSAYLEQLLTDLKRGGFVKSLRGAQGGYLLSRSSADLKVKDIILHLEGPFGMAQSDAKRGMSCWFWKDIEAKLDEAFDVSLESVVLSQQRIEKVVTYNI